MQVRQVLRRRPPSAVAAGDEPVGGSTVGCSLPDLSPQDVPGFEQRRRRKQDVVHRGHW